MKNKFFPSKITYLPSYTTYFLQGQLNSPTYSLFSSTLIPGFFKNIPSEAVLAVIYIEVVWYVWTSLKVSGVIFEMLCFHT